MTTTHERGYTAIYVGNGRWRIIYGSNWYGDMGDVDSCVAQMQLRPFTGHLYMFLGTNAPGLTHLTLRGGAPWAGKPAAEGTWDELFPLFCMYLRMGGNQ